MKTETVLTFEKKLDETREQIIDIDVILPDYYPEVNRILKCSAVLSAESVTNAGDKLSVAGVADVTIVFAGENGDVRVYESSQKYTKVIQCDSLTDGDKCFVGQDVTQLNYKATGPRRLEIRTTASVRAIVYSNEAKEIVEDFEDNSVESLSEVIDCNRVQATENLIFDLNDTVKLPDGISSDAELINATAEPIIRETKIIKNKIMLKGSCNVQLVVCQPELGVKGFSAEVPFTEIREVYGADEGSECSVSARCINPKLSFKAMNGGNDVPFSVHVEANVIIYRQESITAFTDAYSIGSEIKPMYSELRIIGGIVPIDCSAEASVEADLYDSATPEVVASFADNIRFSINKSNENARLNGTAVLNTVMKNSSGKYHIVGRTSSFECEVKKADEYFVCVTCVRAVAEIVGNGKVRITAVFAVKGFGIVLQNRKTIRSITAADGVGVSNSSSGIALYYARHGEKLWDIAKENKCRIALLKELNELEGDEIGEDNAIIVPVKM